MSDNKDHTEKKKPGRPHGSRSKTALMKAQLMVDEFSLEAVGNVIALARNDKEHFENSLKSDVPATIMLAANKVLMDKAIANEKDKLGELKTPSTPSEEGTSEDTEGKVVRVGPKVFASAK